MNEQLLTDEDIGSPAVQRAWAKSWRDFYRKQRDYNRAAKAAKAAEQQGCDEDGCDGRHYAKFKCKRHFDEWAEQHGALAQYQWEDDGVYIERTCTILTSSQNTT